MLHKQCILASIDDSLALTGYYKVLRNFDLLFHCVLQGRLLFLKNLGFSEKNLPQFGSQLTASKQSNLLRRLE